MKRIYEIRYKKWEEKTTYNMLCSNMKAVYKFFDTLNKEELEFAYVSCKVLENGWYFLHPCFKNGSRKEPFKNLWIGIDRAD